MVSEIWEEPEREKQNKLKLKREQNEGTKNEKVSRERKKTDNEKCEGIIELNENQGQQLRKLIERNVNKTGIKLEPTHMKKHKIDVQGHEPIKQRYCHVSLKVREYMYEEIDKMLEEDVIEPSNSD